MKVLIRGAVIGAVATVPMSLLMLGAKRAGLMGAQPPEKITARLMSRAGWRRRSKESQDLAATLLHLGFGAGAGALFAVLRRSLRLPLPAVVQGVAFGSGVWFVSYMGWVPWLQIMPPADEDRPGRPQTMLAAHWVYGGVLGALSGRR
jgi:hypothetical protein